MSSMSSDDKKLLRSKGQKSSITWRWDKEGKRSSYFEHFA